MLPGDGVQRKRDGRRNFLRIGLDRRVELTGTLYFALGDTSVGFRPYKRVPENHNLCADGLEALLVEVLPELAVGHRENQILAKSEKARSGGIGRDKGHQTRPLALINRVSVCSVRCHELTGRCTFISGSHRLRIASAPPSDPFLFHVTVYIGPKFQFTPVVRPQFAPVMVIFRPQRLVANKAADFHVHTAATVWCRPTLITTTTSG
jgi:hypothetical protein